MSWALIPCGSMSQRREASYCGADMMPGRGQMIDVNGISLHVEDHGAGDPVLLIHGWPDSAFLWRNQIPFLVAHGFRVIAPDMRGFGRSSQPDDVAAYALRNAVADVAAILDALGLEAAHLVGHDWGAAVAWLTAMFHPGRRAQACCPVRPASALAAPRSASRR